MNTEVVSVLWKLGLWVVLPLTVILNFKNLQPAGDPMHNFQMSFSKRPKSVLGFVVFINAVASGYLKQRINFSRWPCSQVSEVSYVNVFSN